MATRSAPKSTSCAADRYLEGRSALVVRKFFPLFLILLALPALRAQRSQENFGKNRVQHREFEWKLISTDNFNIYYYIDANNVAYNAARYAEEDFDRITDQIGYTPYTKVTLIIYNSITDLQQSNIGLVEKAFVGGETQLLKSKIEIAYPGSQSQFRQDLSQEISQLLINLMLFGGSFREMVQSSYFLSLPQWFTAGASAYVAEGWSAEKDDAIRAEFPKRSKKPANLVGKDAVLVGQSIWNYIEVKHGRDKMSAILNLVRVIRNEELAISSTLGISYEVFIDRWRRYYTDVGPSDAALIGTVDPPKDQRVRRRNFRRRNYEQVAVSPSGQYVAYSENLRGKYRIKVLDTQTGKKKQLLRGGRRRVDQRIDYSIPVLEWVGDTSVAFVHWNRGKTTFQLKHINGKTIAKVNFKVIDGVRSMDAHSDGRYFIMSAVKDGQTDIFSYDWKDNRFRRLTIDLYDDLDPAYLPGGYDFVFSSNRLTDTLKSGDGAAHLITNRYDLFIYNKETEKTDSLVRLTFTDANERLPQPLGDTAIVFLGEAGRMQHLYSLNRASGEARRMSDYSHNIRHYDLNAASGTLAFVMADGGKEYAYVNPEFDTKQRLDTYSGELLIRDRWRKRPRLSPPEPPYPLDSLGRPIDLPAIDSLEPRMFLYESQALRMIKAWEKEKARMAKAEIEKHSVKLKGPSDYKPQLGVNYVVTALTVDPLRGTGVLFDFGTSDLYNNHQFNAGILLISDLRSSSFSGEWRYLAWRPDLRLSFDKSSAFFSGDIAVQRYNTNTFTAEVAYPLTPATRVAIAPFWKQTRFINMAAAFTPQDDVVDRYVGTTAEIVVDNTEEIGLNMLEGTRFRLMLQTHRHTQDDRRNFQRLNLDLRHYLRLHKEIILAGRAGYGRFFGNDPKKFAFGGIDNWLFYDSEFSGLSDDPLNAPIDGVNPDIFFIEYVTNVRGFKYNTRFGQNYVVANLELRVPIVRYLYNGPIGSSFLRNLQVIGFSDMGTAWTGGSPFTRSNSINTTQFQAGNFSGEVTNYQNPFLMSYGVGARSLLFGYYVKLDLAWPYDRGELQDPALYLSLGYDF